MVAFDEPSYHLQNRKFESRYEILVQNITSGAQLLISLFLYILHLVLILFMKY